MNRNFFLNTEITFGKFKGQNYTVKDLIDLDQIEYVEWMIETFNCNDEIQLYIDNFLENIPPLEESDTSFLDKYTALEDADFLPKRFKIDL